MTVILHLARLEELRNLVRWSLQPHIRYEWSNEDLFTVASVPGSDAEVPAASTLWVELKRLDPEDPVLDGLTEWVDCKPAKALPLPEKTPSENKPAGSGRRRTRKRRWRPKPERSKPPEPQTPLREFIRRIRLTPAREEVRHRALLVSVGRDDAEIWREVYGSAPKNPVHASETFFLAPRDAEPMPRFVFTIPGAPTNFDWSHWIERTQIRFPDSDVRLFYQLPSAMKAHFFVEYGYAHPLPEMREFYCDLLPPGEPTPSHVLICSDASSKDTRWIEWAPIDGDRLENRRSPEGAGAQIVLQDAPRIARPDPVATQHAPTLELQPELIEMPGTGDGRLRAIEDRIQSERELLSRLEDERRQLVDRSRERFRFALRFRQKLGAPERPTPRASRFERFLRLSRGRHGELDYAFFVEADAEDAGSHFVLTREALLFAELPLGLADEVFVQPSPWKGWGLPLFVEEGFELRPRIDQHPLAQSFAQQLSKSVAINDGRVVLARPAPDGAATAFDLTAIRFSGESLAQAVELAHPSATVAIPESLARAQAELREWVGERQDLLARDLVGLETTLRDEQQRRLDGIQQLWNGVAPELEKTANQASLTRAHLDEAEGVLDEAGRSWEKVVKTLVDLHERLVAGMLRALDNLENWTPAYLERLAKTQRANVDVAQLLADLEARLAPALEAAHAEHAKAKEEHEALVLAHGRVAPQLEKVKSDIAALETDAQGRRARIDGQCEELERRVAAVRAVLAELETLIARLVDLQAELDREIANAATKRDEAQAAIDACGRSRAVLQTRRQEWEQKADEAEREIQEIRCERLRVEGDIGRARERIRASDEESASTLEHVRKDLARLEKEDQRVTARLREIEREKLQHHRLEERVRRLELRETAAERERDQQMQSLSEALDMLNEESQTLSDDTKQKCDATRESLAKLIDDLEELSAVELVSEPVERLRERTQSGAAGVQELKELAPEEYRKIWK